MITIDFYKSNTNTYIIESNDFLIDLGKTEFGYFIDRSTVLLCESQKYSISSIFKLIYRLINNK